MLSPAVSSQSAPTSVECLFLSLYFFLCSVRHFGHYYFIITLSRVLLNQVNCYLRMYSMKARRTHAHQPETPSTSTSTGCKGLSFSSSSQVAAHFHVVFRCAHKREIQLGISSSSSWSSSSSPSYPHPCLL